jgi:hypothetical protein
MLKFSEPPGYRRSAATKRPKLDGFTHIIDGCSSIKQAKKAGSVCTAPDLASVEYLQGHSFPSDTVML